MQYSRIQKWIEWKARKYGLKVIKVNPAYSSTTCPKCGTLMKEGDYRTFRCPKCGFEENRDSVSVLNLYVRGTLHLSTAHRVKDGKDHPDRENPRS